jgi:hypothetical protein
LATTFAFGHRLHSGGGYLEVNQALGGREFFIARFREKIACGKKGKIYRMSKGERNSWGTKAGKRGAKKTIVKWGM